MLLPILISTIIAFAEDFGDSKIINNIFSKIINSKEDIIQNKTNIEVLIGFLEIIGVFIKINTLKVPIIYWNILRFRYLVNPYVYKSFEEINKKVNLLKENKSIPSYIKYIINKIQLMFIYFGNINTKSDK